MKFFYFSRMFWNMIKFNSIKTEVKLTSSFTHSCSFTAALVLSHVTIERHFPPGSITRRLSVGGGEDYAPVKRALNRRDHLLGGRLFRAGATDGASPSLSVLPSGATPAALSDAEAPATSDVGA
jgi:hypothetical protein